MSIDYIGEHLIPGQIGEVLIWTAFITSLLSAVLFYLRTRQENDHRFRLKLVSRTLYLVHVAALIGVSAILYYIIFNHYFEYAYVWRYSSRDLAVEYIISCFWAGQEGSFLIWALFQAIIGVFLIFSSKQWESSAMTFYALSQAILTSMLLGINLGSVNIGASPFELLRVAYKDNQDAIFTYANYLSLIEDGNGLNPLLENIWMTIHPPILFIGYALTLVPFSYAAAAMLRKEYTTWIRPALPWTLLALALLGAGILLGGAWAYVSLTFGGFWAWDPVENSSLVPWMTLMAALHFMIIARKQHFALLASFKFVMLSYVLVLFATYLTRSGVLADTSAHSFGENGMAIQLIVYILLFFFIMVFMIGFNFRKIYEKQQEILLSREFWMFVGGVIIVLSAFQIILMTSVPVLNALFGTNFAPPADAVAFYNRWQTPFALLIAGFIAFTQFLNYDSNDPNLFVRKTLVPIILAAGLTVLFYFLGVVRTFSYILFLFFILFAILATLGNIFFKTSRPRNWGALITHLGFALFLLGALITFSNSKTISTNTSRFDLGSERTNSENLLLLRGDTLYMGGFYVTYVDKSKSGNLTKYRVDFLKRKMGVYKFQFTIHPSVNENPRMGNVYNPDTRRFLWKDYYTYISATSEHPDYIVIRTMVNPYINILWIGSVVMIAGIVYALVRRLRLP